MRKRPSFIQNRHEIAYCADWDPTGERFGKFADLTSAAGLMHLSLVHRRLAPGASMHQPLAYRDREEIVVVLEGNPDLWVDGYLFETRQDDVVWFNDRSGIARTLINNTYKPVDVLSLAEAVLWNTVLFYAGADKAKENGELRSNDMFWSDPPKRKQGPHDGKSDQARGAPSPKGSRKKGKPPFVVNWHEILGAGAQSSYPNSKEVHGIDALLNPHTRLSRIGCHVEVLQPGHRTSWPHAERDEEEFVYVMQGNLDCWLDGHIHPIAEGDFVGWESRTGLTHVVINNSEEDAVLLVGGEASRMRNQYWYPFHPHRNKEVGKEYWADHPVPKLGPHDGLPDKLRASLPAAARRTALAANTAAWMLGMREKKK